MNAAVEFVHEQLTNKKQHPKFKAGDNITVNYKIIEGGKERIQSFSRRRFENPGKRRYSFFYCKKNF